MEENTLYKQKVGILGRLIKESSLTLEEALIFLKEEEDEEVEQPVSTPNYTPWVQPTYIPYNPTFVTTTTGTSFPTGGTSTIMSGTSNMPINADLNT